MWPTVGASGTTRLCISYKLSHQIVPLAMVPILTILASYKLQVWPPGGAICIATLTWNALLALSVNIGLVSSSARVTSVKSAKGLVVCFRHSDPQTWDR